MPNNDTPESLAQKLARALRSKAVLAERSKQLQQQVEDYRKREETMSHVATELLERQRELNYMLHRASSVLHQLQDTNLALSAEFTHIVKELPAPQDRNWNETVNRVNDLFKKTHELAGEMQNDIFRAARAPEPADSPSPQPSPVTIMGTIPQVKLEIPTPEPPVQEQHASDRQEVIQEAQISEPEQTPVPVQEQIASDSKPSDEQLIAARPTASLDELFARVDEMGFAEPDDDRPAQKQGFFARLLARVSEE